VSADDVITNDFQPRTSARRTFAMTAEDFPANIGPIIMVREGMIRTCLFVGRTGSIL
jgi:hypothetical protein